MGRRTLRALGLRAVTVGVALNTRTEAAAPKLCDAALQRCERVHHVHPGATRAADVVCLALTNHCGTLPHPQGLARTAITGVHQPVRPDSRVPPGAVPVSP